MVLWLYVLLNHSANFSWVIPLGSCDLFPFLIYIKKESRPKLFLNLYISFSWGVILPGGHDRSIHLATIPARRSLHAYLYSPNPTVQILIISHNISKISNFSNTRSVGALRAPTSSWRPFGPLDFVLRALRALRPCDPCIGDWIVC